MLTFKKLEPWMVFVSCLLLFGVGATPLGRMADHIFVAFRFTGVLLLSILVVRRTFRNSGNNDHCDSLLESFDRWCRGESGT